MFSGIVEGQGRVLDVIVDRELLRISVERPVDFTDLKPGDSVATNGVCLTVESCDERQMVFALGAETLRVTGWSAPSLKEMALNLERSLRFGDRIHGHMVSGHVDGTGEIIEALDQGGSTLLVVRAPETLIPYVWKKGSWAVNGVSLTVNDISGDRVSMCLIPETLKRTNLRSLRRGARVNLEIDMMARGLIHYLESSRELGAVIG